MLWLKRISGSVAARKDDAPADVQAAIVKASCLSSIVCGAILIYTASG
jgi:hypothetical protein